MDAQSEQKLSKAFLTYMGNRKWRKVRSSKAPVERNYLKYAGNRKWKKVSADLPH